MKTLKLRIKDKHSKVLDQLASEVNFVWNYVNDLGFKHLKRKGEFLQNKYYEMLEDGSFINLIKETILSDLTRETLDWSNVEPFDRLCFKVTENKLGEGYDHFK